MTKTIKLLYEDNTGHSTIDVPIDNVKEVITDNLKDDRWLNIESKDNTNEIITKKDIEKVNDNSISLDNWLDEVDDDNIVTADKKENDIKPKQEKAEVKFEDIESITSVKASRGG